jgi:hypothetical protein
VRLRAGRVCTACLIWALPSGDVLAAGEGGYELVFSTYACASNLVAMPWRLKAVLTMRPEMAPTRLTL